MANSSKDPVESQLLRDVSIGIGETVVHGSEGKGYFLKGFFADKAFADKVVEAFPKGAAEVMAWQGEYAINIKNPKLNQEQMAKIKLVLAQMRTSDTSRKESQGEQTEKFVEALNNAGFSLQENRSRLSEKETFEMELKTPLFQYQHHAQAAIKAFSKDVAKVESFQEGEGDKKVTRYRVVFDKEALGKELLGKGETWRNEQVKAIGAAHEADKVEVQKRTQKSQTILAAFARVVDEPDQKNQAPTHRAFNIDGVGFNNRENAQDVATALGGGASVVESSKGNKFYIRISNALAIEESRLQGAIDIALQRREQEKQLLTNLGTALGEEIRPYEADFATQKSNGSLGYRYRVGEVYKDPAQAEQARAALAKFNGIMPSSVPSLVKVVPGEGGHILLLDASQWTEEKYAQLHTETTSKVKAARTQDTYAGIPELLKEFSAETKEYPFITFKPGIASDAKLAATMEQLNTGAAGQPLYEEFATLKGKGKDAVITLNMESRPVDFVARVTAAKETITTQRQTELEAENKEKRQVALEALKQNIGEDGVTFTARDDGKGVDVGFKELPPEVERNLLKALGIVVDPKNLGDKNLGISDLADITPQEAQAAGAVYKQYKADLVIEAARGKKQDALQVLAGDVPLVRGADKKTVQLFMAPEEAQAVVKALGNDAAKIPDQNNLGGVLIDLDQLDVSKIADAQKAQGEARTAAQKAAEQQAEEEEKKKIKLAEEEKRKKESKDQTNQWINIGGPILGAIVGLFMGGGFTIGGIISAIAVGAAAWIGTQAFTETGLFAKSDPNASSSPAATANGTSPQVSGPEQQEQGQGAALPNGTPVAPMSTPTVEPTTPAAGASPGR